MWHWAGRWQKRGYEGEKTSWEGDPHYLSAIQKRTGIISVPSFSASPSILDPTGELFFLHFCPLNLFWSWGYTSSEASSRTMWVWRTFIVSSSISLVLTNNQLNVALTPSNDHPFKQALDGLTVASQSNVFQIGMLLQRSYVRRGNRRGDWLTDCLLMLNVWAKTWSWRFGAWIRSRVEAFLPNVHAFFFQMHAPRPPFTVQHWNTVHTPKTTKQERTASS